MPQTTKENDDTPAGLKPFLFHGVDLQHRHGNSQAVGECPFCGKNKFMVNVESTLWDCKVCAMKGNGVEFLRELWKTAALSTTHEHRVELCIHRSLLDPETLNAWGVVRSHITGDWLVPGYGITGEINTLYRYRKALQRSSSQGSKRLLMITPETHHQMHGLPLLNPKASQVYVCEGIWDACAMWEMLRGTKHSDEPGVMTPTGNPDVSLAADVSVIGVPGANVWNVAWSPIFSGKHVTFFYDNDYERKHSQSGKVTPSVGYEGMRRASQMLGGSESPPETLHILNWGEGGYDPLLPDGCDVRDMLSGSATSAPGYPLDDYAPRIYLLQEILSRVVPLPDDWIVGRSAESVKKGQSRLEPIECYSWKKLITSWRKSMKWTEGLNRALCVMLACVATTKKAGDQLWAKIIGPASCGKSTLCEAISTAYKYVLAKSTIRGFHSGFQTDRQGSEDNSLIAQVRDKTLITKDGDTLLSSPNLSQILAEARDIYDRTSRTHYRNAMSKDYSGVNMTWLLCGTSSLRKLDKSELGERFIDCVIMDEIDPELEDDILDRVFIKARAHAGIEVGDAVDSQTSPEMTETMRLTAGYVNYLRSENCANSNDIEWPDEMIRCVKSLGKFVSYMRARPSMTQDETSEREFSARLVSQFTRLAIFVAIVLNRSSVDEEVMRIVRRTALDTARGHTLQLCEHLYKAQHNDPPGLVTKSLHILCDNKEERTNQLIRFLRKIKAIQSIQVEALLGMKALTHPRWMLTPLMYNLYAEVLNGDGN